MNDAFADRVRSAAVAGWWTILIGSLFLVLQWLASQMLLSTKPRWLLTLWDRASPGRPCGSSGCGSWRSSRCACG
jgi:hypothetical protein